MESAGGAMSAVISCAIALVECSLSLREPESATGSTRRVRAEKTTQDSTL